MGEYYKTCKEIEMLDAKINYIEEQLQHSNGMTMEEMNFLQDKKGNYEMIRSMTQEYLEKLERGETDI